MKTLLVITFTLTSLIAKCQCDVLNVITSSTGFEGVAIRYFQVDSNVQIEYEYKGYRNRLGDDYSFPCGLLYGPAIPKPIWRNENFICFHRGCGTSCFSNYLAPLNNRYQAEYGGQFLIDTTNTIFMSLLQDDVTYEPYLELKNHTTGKTQTVRFSREDFPVAVPIEYLDYSRPHENGFTYSNKELTLHLMGNCKLKVRVKI